jgi:hypothetical protein
LKEGIDTEYLVELCRQTRVNLTGLLQELNRVPPEPKGGRVLMFEGKTVSFDYLIEKANMAEKLLHTIEKDILLKSGRLRSLEN